MWLNFARSDIRCAASHERELLDIHKTTDTQTKPDIGATLLHKNWNSNKNQIISLQVVATSPTQYVVKHRQI